MPDGARKPNAQAPGDQGWLHAFKLYYTSGAVCFQQNPAGISEVVIELSGTLMNLYRVFQSAERFKISKQIIEVTLLST